MYKIELTEEQAIFWRKCMENEDNINTLLNQNVFETKRGSTTLNFDKEGKMSSINTSIHKML